MWGQHYISKGWTKYRGRKQDEWLNKNGERSPFHWDQKINQKEKLI